MLQNRKLLLIDLKNNTDIIKENLTYHFIFEKGARYIFREEFDTLYIIEQIYYEFKRRFEEGRFNIIIHLPKRLLPNIKEDYEYMKTFKTFWEDPFPRYGDLNYRPFFRANFSYTSIKINIIGEDHIIFGHKNNDYKYYVDFSKDKIEFKYYNEKEEN